MNQRARPATKVEFPDPRTDQGEDNRTPALVGRPRDPLVEFSIIEAARSLLAEVGFQKLTVQAVAKRAGVSAPTIYLRWPSKVALVEAAVFPAVEAEVPSGSSGDLRKDLLVWTRVLTLFAADPTVRSAIPGLISSYHQDTESFLRLVERSVQPARSALNGILLAAVARGEARPDYAIDTIFELLTNTTLIRGLVQGDEGVDGFVERIAGALWELARSR